MRFLLILALASTLAAQLAPRKYLKPNTNAPVDPPKAHWAGLRDVQIPTHCQHPMALPLQPVVKQMSTCGVFVRFSEVPKDLPYFRLQFRVWEAADARSEDSVYRIYLMRPSWRGVTVYGRPGHKLLLEVTYR